MISRISRSYVVHNANPCPSANRNETQELVSMDNALPVKTAVILIGIPASGKTAFFTEYFMDEYIHINLDTLHTRKKETLLLTECLSEGKSFVVDNTNPVILDRQRYIVAAKAEGYRVLGYFFQSVLADCIARNKNRTGKARVPDVAIALKSNELELPCMKEGFDALYYVKLDDGGFIVEEWKNEL